MQRSLSPLPTSLSVVLLAVPLLQAQVDWNRVHYFQARGDFAMSYDTARTNLVVCGGTGDFVTPPETWELQGVDWQRSRTTTAPDSFASAAMVYVPTRQRSILFGGQTATLFLNQAATSSATWSWDGQDWVRLNPVRSPPPRWRHAMAYDEARDRVVLFGGAAETRGDPPDASYTDTWEWDGQDWMRIATTSPSPPQRVEHAMAYDASRGRVVLFGGNPNRSTSLADTWEWNGVAWQSAATPNAPSPRRGHAMAFDRIRNRTVLFGGWDGQLLGDTWEWDGSTWTQKRPVSAPSPRRGHRMVWDPVRGAVVMIGGRDSDAWTWDGTSWTQILPSQSPVGESLAVFDSQRGVTVLITENHLWEWDGRVWTRLPAAGFGPIFREPVAAYDETRGVIVVVAGAETWEWDGTSWTRHMLATAPQGVGSSLAYDSVRRRMVLYGGWDYGRQVSLADTWEWDGSTWRLRATSGPPPVRNQGMAFDKSRGVTVVLAGSETWEWDGAVWRGQQSAVWPVGPRDFSGMVYDERRQRAVFFGGGSGNVFSRSPGTWEWDGSEWTNRGVVHEPAPRYAKNMVYDSRRGLTVLFGGEGVGRNWHADIWEYGPTHPAALDLFGSGCASSVGTAFLSASPDVFPWLGASVALSLGGVPAGAPAAMNLGTSRSVWRGTPLPLPLDRLGMPNCELLASPDLASASMTGGQWSARVPSDRSLLGVELFAQGVIGDPGANAAGVVVTDAAALRIGGR